MLLKLSRAFIEETGVEKLQSIGISRRDVEDTIRYGRTHLSIDADEYDEDTLKALHEVASKSKKFGAKTIAFDLNMLFRAMKEEKGVGKDGAKGFLKIYLRRVEHFATYLKKYMDTQSPHRIYMHSPSRGVMYCCYIYDIEFHPKQKTRDYIYPEYVDFTLAWREFGEVRTKTISFHREDCLFTNVRDAMTRKDLFFSDKALDEQYEQSVEKFNSIVENIGEQYLASGTGTEDVDEREYSYWYRNSEVVLDREGEPSNIVIDVFSEGDKERTNNRRESRPDMGWWVRVPNPGEEEEEKVEELPLHPNLVVFALKKQMRLRVHVDQLVKYEYDDTMGDKLVLPVESKELIETLLDFDGEFQDIVKNKGGGAAVLCTGPAGTGKTLTSEVFAEVMHRPLYTVQCSQLGVTPDELEKELLTVFSRSERWKAILLLDEADVYIRQRGDDINQNAIVGVFLRVMEYYRGVMFMTTNRPDVIEDAIASRCIAKIEYTLPESKEAAEELWKVLADVQGIPVTKAVVTQLVSKHGYNKLSGRDIKNLLKLSKLVMKKKNSKSLDVKTVNFVKQFKPTE